MKETYINLALASQQIAIPVLPSPKAKRYILRANQRKRQITLTVPKRYSLQYAQDFVQQKQGWIADKYQLVQNKNTLTPGAEISLLGQEYRLVLVNQPIKTQIQGREILVGGRASLFTSKVKLFLFAYIKQEIAFLVENYAAQTSRKYGKLSVKEMHSRFGSCNSKGDLAFCWRIVFAPRYALEYLVAHEVAHLTHMNHSSQFWQLVAKLCPHFQRGRRFLRERGSVLFQY